MKGKRSTRASQAQEIQIAIAGAENSLNLDRVDVEGNETAQTNANSRSPGNDVSGHSSPGGIVVTHSHNQPPTPATPKSPASSSEHGGTGTSTPNPGTPGGGNPGMIPTCTSPTYVSLSVDPDDSTYVYMEGTETAPLYTSTSSANGQTLYYGVGEAYDSVTQQYTPSPGTSHGIAYAQENGITYVVQTANNGPITNNNSGGMSNLNMENESQQSLPNVTKVSPATKNRKNVDMKFDLQSLGRLFAKFGIYNLEDRVAVIETSLAAAEALFKNVDANGVGETISKMPQCFNSAPVTVQWLLQNYETAEGVSLPRSTLYFHYIRHCREHKLDPVNAASFGKLIRSVFLGLRTRRLGTRGNSKYHYYGIRLKPDSPLNGIDESMIADFLAEGGFTLRANGRGVINPKPNPLGHMRGPTNKRYRNPRDIDDFGVLSSTDAGTIQHFLGDSSKVMDGLSFINTDFELPEGLTQDDVKTFGDLYLAHCGNLLSDVKNFQLSGFQRRWYAFWRFAEGITSHAQVLEQNELELRLPKSKLKALCTLKEIQEYVQRTDTEFYQALADILVPEALRPVPSAMSNSIRNFAKGIDECLADVVMEYPVKMSTIKLKVVGLFSQALRRRTSLNHLAQAARAVLQNEAQIKQMVNDLSRIDFRNIDEQASWVSGCNGNFVEELVDEFQNTLANHKSLEEWAAWLEAVVDKALHSFVNTEQYANNARLFLLKWSYYSSFVIRDLTLRSAASFGSFHLLRLLYDEFLYFIIENRVAKATGIPAIAILSKSDTNFFAAGLEPRVEDDEMSEV